MTEESESAKPVNKGQFQKGDPRINRTGLQAKNREVEMAIGSPLTCWCQTDALKGERSGEGYLMKGSEFTLQISMSEALTQSKVTGSHTKGCYR